MIISCYQSKPWDFAAGSYSLLSFASRKQNLSGREKFQRTWNLSGFREKYCFAMHGWMRAPQLVWTACAEVSAFLRGTLSLRTHTPRHITKQKTLRKCRRFVKCLWRKAHDLAAWCEFAKGHANQKSGQQSRYFSERQILKGARNFLCRTLIVIRCKTYISIFLACCKTHRQNDW